jgi:hypothetical protein
MNESANDHLKRIKMRPMKIRLKILIWATTAAILAVFPISDLFGRDTGRSTGRERGNYILPATESFHTKAVPLESDRPLPHQEYGAADKAAEQAGHMYSFVLHGTAQPGVVGIEVLDSNGQVVERTTGKLTGEGRAKQGTSQRQWKSANFKMLGFTDNSNVLTKKLVEGTKVTITSEKGWVVATMIGTPVQAQRLLGKGQGQVKSAGTQITEPNAAASQNVGQDTETGIVRIPTQNLPQDPLRTAIHNGIQKAVQETLQQPNLSPQGKLAIQSIQVMQNPATNASQSALQNGSQNVVTNGAANIANTANSVQQDTTPNADASNLIRTKRTLAVPPEFQAGISALQSAQNSLKSAGEKWGGHKQKAADLINQALAACGQPGIPPGEAQPANSSSADALAAMQAALTQLTNAKNAFANAGNAWDGRRDQVATLIDQALSEVQAGIDFAKSHNTS